jgi:hypothetical protein
MTTELIRQAEQLYKDLESGIEKNPNAIASEVTVKTYNAILEEAKKRDSHNTMISALPIASDGTNVSDLLKMLGQIRENVPPDSGK